jgi:hypothetical protein
VKVLSSGPEIEPPSSGLQEENVIANINDEGSVFKGNTNVKLEFYTETDSKILKSYNVPIYVKTYNHSIITTKTLKVGEAINFDNIKIAKIETTNYDEDNILVLVENVFQISESNYDLSYNHLGSGDTYIVFTSPVPLGKFVTLYFGFAN